MYFKFLEEQPKSSEKLILKTDSEIGKSSEVVYGRLLIFFNSFYFVLRTSCNDIMIIVH